MEIIKYNSYTIYSTANFVMSKVVVGVISDNFC